MEELDTFDFKQQFKKIQNEIQSKTHTIEIIRKQFPNNEFDNQLRDTFLRLKSDNIVNEIVEQIQFLVYSKGARLACTKYILNEFNFAQAFNQHLFRYLNDVHSVSKPSLTSITKVFETLILSNPNLLTDEDRVDVEETASLWYFLFYCIYQLQYYYYAPPEIFINMQCYQTILRLLLVALACQQQTQWNEDLLFTVLKIIPSNEIFQKNNLSIQTIQTDILNIIIELSQSQNFDENQFQIIFHDLIKKNRLDILLLLYHQLSSFFEKYFNNPNNIHRNINILTSNSTGRELFDVFLNEKPLKSWLTSHECVFLLLQKKERKSLEKLFRSDQNLIQLVDNEGNNVLLYVCLKVRGCRHRIIEFLLQIGCNTEQRNNHGENFYDAIQLNQNRKLFKDLIDNHIQFEPTMNYYERV